VFLNSGSVTRRLASLHWLQQGTVRQLLRYYQDALTSCRPSHRASLPPLGSTSGPLVAFAPRRTSAPPRPGVGHPVSPAGNGAEETTGSPKFLENPDCPFAHVQSTPAGLRAPDLYGAAAWPLVCEQQRLPRKVFRRSIAWLSDSLSTLRRVGYPTTTQDSLPAAGQALPDGLSTRRVPMKGFRSAFLHLILLSQAWLGTITSTQASRRVFPKAVAPIAVSKINVLSCIGVHTRCRKRQFTMSIRWGTPRSVVPEGKRAEVGVS